MANSHGMRGDPTACHEAAGRVKASWAATAQMLTRTMPTSRRMTPRVSDTSDLQRHLGLVAEEALWSEDHEEGEAEADEHEPDLADLDAVHDVVDAEEAVVDRLPQEVVGQRQ